MQDNALDEPAVTMEIRRQPGELAGIFPRLGERAMSCVVSEAVHAAQRDILARYGNRSARAAFPTFS
jgi:hypothetical protein